MSGEAGERIGLAKSRRCDFTKGDGLLPAIVQDADSGAVLMLGYMNREALARRRSSAQRVVFFSRSKQRLWEKGETSGHTLDLVDVRADCDRDTLLVTARPRGPVCHTRHCHLLRRRAQSHTPSGWRFLAALEGHHRAAHRRSA